MSIRSAIEAEVALGDILDECDVVLLWDLPLNAKLAIGRIRRQALALEDHLSSLTAFDAAPPIRPAAGSLDAPL
jgi:hypothetical protein